jgi:hypothetical protein
MNTCISTYKHKPALNPLRVLMPTLAIFASAAIFSSAHAQVPSSIEADKLPMPFGECRIGYWSGTRNLDSNADVAKLTCLAQWRVPLGEGLRANASARAGVADALERASERTDRGTARVREAYIEYENGPLRIRAGQQIIAWGRADRINPTDNLSPSDFTFLSQEDDEQRQGIAALSVQAKFTGPWSVTGIYVPRFTPHVVPVGSLPHGIVFENRPHQPEYAVKLDRSGDDLDFSVSYYEGFNRFVRYRLNPPFFSSAGTPAFRANFDKQQTIGADVAFNIGKFSVRGEGATSRYSSSSEATRRVDRMVLGVDRNFLDTANINAQLFAIHRADYGRTPQRAAPLQPLFDALDRLNSEFGSAENGATLRISNKFFNEQLRAEFNAVYDFTHHSYLLRPRLAYSFTDALKLLAGADYFCGREQSYFGTLKKNNVAYMEFVLVF